MTLNTENVSDSGINLSPLNMNHMLNKLSFEDEL